MNCQITVSSMKIVDGVDSRQVCEKKYNPERIIRYFGLGGFDDVLCLSIALFPSFL